MIRRIISKLMNDNSNSNSNSNSNDAHAIELMNNQQKIKEMEEIISYLYYEVSELRSKIRYLIADSSTQATIPLQYSKQTCESFDYQWHHLLESKYLLSDQEFRTTVSNLICSYTQLDEQWFENKSVLDAGCGQGRFTYGLAKLGANVQAFDQSTGGLEYAQKSCQEFTDKVAFFTHNILEPLTTTSQFDLVWCYGVLHHTGNTYQALQNILPAVKSGGYLFLMIYGEPRIGKINEFTAQAEYSYLRRITKNKSFGEKVEILLREKSDQKEYIHGWFDAISPSINDTYSFEEIEGWLLAAGFSSIKLTMDYANHHIIAQKI